MSAGDEDHYLFEYLSTTLPTLGLDPETYGPYVTGLFPLDDDDVDDDNNEDELNGMVELLQSSSETHSDDEEVWGTLKNEILNRRNEFWEMKTKQKEHEKDRYIIENKKRLELLQEEARQQEIQLALEKELKLKQKKRKE